MSESRSEHRTPGRLVRLTLPVALIAVASVVTLFRTRSVGDSATDSAQSIAGWADENSCIDCHDQALDFEFTGHANTLRRAADQVSRQKLEQLNMSGIEGLSIDLADGEGPPIVTHREGPLSQQMPLDWCFGSGMHAHTWTTTLSDTLGATDLLEFRWTWYHSTEGFDVTPGQSAESAAHGISALGLQFDGPKADRCFSCHASAVPASDGAIVENEIHLGVTCQRCHGPRQRHVESEGEYHDPVWQWGDRMEAVRRCGLCHRMPQERDAHEIRPGNPDIVRFQPIGLLQSACFQNSEMTCTTCHNPHRPMEAQDSRRIDQCVQCHDPAHEDHTLCGAGESDNCLACHMPAIEMEFPVAFTDHWIRVREPSGDGE